MQNLSPITDTIRLNHTPITASSSLMAHVTPSRNLTAYMQPPLHDSSITASLRLRQSHTNGPPAALQAGLLLIGAIDQLNHQNRQTHRIVHRVRQIS